MEHTNEFLMGMFAAYMGCEVMNTDDGKHLKMIGVSGSFISVYEPPYPFCESEGDEYEWMYSECKPILPQRQPLNYRVGNLIQPPFNGVSSQF